MLKDKIRLLDLQLFTDPNTNTTTQTGTGQDLSPEMKTFYDKVLIKNAVPKLVHDQFAQEKPIPKGGGKIIEFRKYSPFAKALTPLTEGVTPDGKKLNVTVITATVAQYGDYVTLSDMLILTAIDNNMVEATELLGNQAGETLDTVTREILNSGTNVIYAGGVASRQALTGTQVPKVIDFQKVARKLKTNKAQKISGHFIAIIHPDAAYDVMRDSEWINASQYAGSGQIFEGEIGKIAGIRFVETTEAKIFAADNLTAASRNLTVKTTLGAPGKIVAVDEAITAGEATALAGRTVIISGTVHEIASAASGAAGSATITTVDNVAVADGTDGEVITPGEAGADGKTVYSTLVLGANAYGTTKIQGGGLEFIVKQLGSAGTSDPLNQRATVGWKATKVAEILVDAFLVRLESSGTYADATDTAN